MYLSTLGYTLVMTCVASAEGAGSEERAGSTERAGSADPDWLLSSAARLGTSVSGEAVSDSSVKFEEEADWYMPRGSKPISPASQVVASAFQVSASGSPRSDAPFSPSPEG